MHEALFFKAPAKLNLHLAIGGLRKDGFHSLVSIFQAISLFDELEIWLDDTGMVSLACEVACPPQNNTMYRAAELCLHHARKQGLKATTGVGIRARKGIPEGAGLGGGSSDAAAVIKAMASLNPGFYTREAMEVIAARVGSDVPFFLGSACALVGGRGELLEELCSRTDYSILVVSPGFPMQTTVAFRSLDAHRAASGWQLETDDKSVWDPEQRKILSTAYLSCEPGSWPFRNDFYPALVPAYPALARLRELLLESGASFASLSGSGSTVFGVFRALEARERAVFALLEAGFSPIRAFPLARLPELD
jgi:4-diphosphocytidyl-2-C-methyl-D-erythritol kinase